jgi:hypothetical protein
VPVAAEADRQHGLRKEDEGADRGEQPLLP